MAIEIRHKLTNEVLYIYNGADLCGADLRGANLYEANLRRANLCRADLCGANLCRADLRGANLYEANLCRANLRGANLYEANLCRANLRGANLRGADLYGANLCGANLRGADLCRAYLCGANLRGASLYGANLDTDEIKRRQICPPSGSFTAWKKGCNNNIIKLKIPSWARRVSSITGRKCRAEFAIVEEITSHDGKQLKFTQGLYNQAFLYEVGQTVAPDSYDASPLIECSNGIHFFITKQEAEDWLS